MFVAGTSRLFGWLSDFCGVEGAVMKEICGGVCEEGNVLFLICTG